MADQNSLIGKYGGIGIQRYNELKRQYDKDNDLDQDTTIPQRRFGFSVTPEMQQKAIELRARKETLRQRPEYIEIKRQAQQARDDLARLQNQKQLLEQQKKQKLQDIQNAVSASDRKELSVQYHNLEAQSSATDEAISALQQTVPYFEAAQKAIGTDLLQGKEDEVAQISSESTAVYRSISGYDSYIKQAGINRENLEQSLNRANKIKSRLRSELGEAEANAVLKTGNITDEQIKKLSPQSRRALGIPEPQYSETLSTVPAQRLAAKVTTDLTQATAAEQIVNAGKIYGSRIVQKDRTVEFIDKFIGDIAAKVFPQDAEETQLENELASINPQLQADIQAFNAKYGGRELSESEAIQANAEQQALQNRIDQYNSKQNKLEQLKSERESKKSTGALSFLDASHVGGAKIELPPALRNIIKSPEISGQSPTTLRETLIQFGDIPEFLGQQTIQALSKVPGIKPERPQELGKIVDFAAETALFLTPVGIGVIAGRGIAKVTNPALRGKERVIGAIDLAVLGIGAGLKAKSFLEEPLVFKEAPKEVETFSQTKVISALTEEGRIDVAQFNLYSVKSARYAVVIPRYKEITRRVIEEVFPYSNEIDSLEFRRILAGGTKVEIEKPSVALSITDSFLLKNGEIIRPAKVLTKKATASRAEPTVFSFLGGKTEEFSQSIQTVNFSNLTPETRASLIRLAEEKARVPVAQRFSSRILGKGDFDIGEVIVKDIFKVTKSGKEYVLLKPGKTRRIGDITAISKVTGRIDLEIPVQLSENAKGVASEIIESKISVSPADLPRVRGRLRKSAIITDITERVEIEVTRPESPIKVTENFGSKLPRDKLLKLKAQKQEQLLSNESQKLLNETKAKVAVSTVQKLRANTLSDKKLLQSFGYEESQRINSLPLTVGGGGATSAAQRLAQSQRTFNRFGEDSLQNFSILQENKQQERLNLRFNQREDIKQEFKFQTKQLEKQEQKLDEKLVPKITPKITPKNGLSALVPAGRTRLPRKNFNLNFRKNNKSGDVLPGYKTFIISGGKKKYLEGLAPKGFAIEKGEFAVLSGKTSLAATFGIEKTKTKVYGKDIANPVNQKIFRSYKIKQGKRVKLDNQFIQRTTREGGRSGGRLSTQSEIKNIQLARKGKTSTKSFKIL